MTFLKEVSYIDPRHYNLGIYVFACMHQNISVDSNTENIETITDY